MAALTRAASSTRQVGRRIDSGQVAEVKDTGQAAATDQQISGDEGPRGASGVAQTSVASAESRLTTLGLGHRRFD